MVLRKPASRWLHGPANRHLPGAVGAHHLVVAQLSTGKGWRVDAEPGYVLQEASWTFDETWLYFGETLSGANNVHKLYRIRRVKLTQLDAWGKPL